MLVGVIKGPPKCVTIKRCIVENILLRKFFVLSQTVCESSVDKNENQQKKWLMSTLNTFMKIKETSCLCLVCIITINTYFDTTHMHTHTHTLRLTHVHILETHQLSIVGHINQACVRICLSLYPNVWNWQKKTPLPPKHS